MVPFLYSNITRHNCWALHGTWTDAGSDHSISPTLLCLAAVA